MAAKNRAFLIAFRTLVASLSLLSLLMLSLQAYPRYRPMRLIAARFGFASAPQEVAETPAADDDNAETCLALDDPFSGSVSGDDASAPDSADDSQASAMTEAAASVDAQHWESRLTELERCLVDLKMEQSVHLGGLRDEVVKSFSQLESQITELRTTQQRLELLEQQFSAFQQTAAQTATAEPPVDRVSIRAERREGKSRLLIEARDVSLTELFARLAETLGVNILVDTSVTGNVSLNLELPNSVEALKELCRLERCRHSQDGRLMLISRQEAAPEPVKAEPPETMTKLYRLRYITGTEIRPFVTVVLTPGVGTMGFAHVREASATAESREPPRAILVKDTPAVLAAVDRLVQELDHPGSHAEKPATSVSTSAAANVPPPPEYDPVAAPPPAPAPMPNHAAPQYEQRSGCAHCTSIAPPVITSGPRNNRR